PMSMTRSRWRAPLFDAWHAPPAIAHANAIARRLAGARAQRKHTGRGRAPVVGRARVADSARAYDGGSLISSGKCRESRRRSACCGEESSTNVKARIACCTGELGARERERGKKPLNSKESALGLDPRRAWPYRGGTL